MRDYIKEFAAKIEALGPLPPELEDPRFTRRHDNGEVHNLKSLARRILRSEQETEQILERGFLHPLATVREGESWHFDSAELAVHRKVVVHTLNSKLSGDAKQFSEKRTAALLSLVKRLELSPAERQRAAEIPSAA